MANSKANSLPTGTLKTKHVASHFGVKPVQLRRVLRSMSRYADGVHTNYRWTMPGDKNVIAEIGKAIQARAEQAEKAKAEAQKALAPAAKKLTAKTTKRVTKIAPDPIAARQAAAQESFERNHPDIPPTDTVVPAA